MIIEISDETPQVWKDLLEGFALLSKGATESYPTHCEHDEMTICADPHKFTRDELLKLDQLGFHYSDHLGFTDDGEDEVPDPDDEDVHVEDYPWTCTEEWCDSHFYSFKYGSA